MLKAGTWTQIYVFPKPVMTSGAGRTFAFMGSILHKKY